MSLKTGAPRRGAPSFLVIPGIALCLAVLISTVYPAVPVLVIQVAGKPVYSSEVAVGDTLTNYYVHSVEKTPVYEYLRIEEAGFRVIGTDMQSYGAGLPTEMPDGFSIKNGWIHVPLNIPIKQLRLMSSGVTTQAVILNHVNFDLNNYPQGTPVDILLTRRPLIWLRLRRVLL